MIDQKNRLLKPFERDVVEAVVETWSRDKVALSLARLGQMLTRRGYDVRAELEGKKLTQLIQRQLNDLITVVPHPSDSLHVAAVPVEVDVSDPATVFAPKIQKPSSLSEERIPKFAKAIWNAFTRQLADGAVRTLSLEPKPNFQDVSAEAAEAAGKYRIERSDIEVDGPAPSIEQQARTSQRIMQWAERNGVQVHYLTARSQLSLGHSFEAERDTSLLHRLLSSLSTEELKSVHLPLNIIKKLLSVE